MISEFHQQRDVQLGPGDVLGASLLAPPFCEDLTTWRLTVDESGLVTQDIFLYCYPLYTKAEVFTRTTQLTKEQLEELLRLADEIDFAGLKDEYDENCHEDWNWTDDDTTTIAFRTSCGVKRVYAYGARMAAELGEADRKRYLRLWDAIAEYAPINSPAWRQERKQFEFESHIEELKRRVTETDFEPPSVKEVLSAVFLVPAAVLIVQTLHLPRGGRPELPTLNEFLIFTGIGYIVAILVQFLFFYSKRRGRLDAEQQLAQYQEDGLTDF